ncbi:MAG: tyrosine--tRNA ligase [Planctomycetota bacterium]|jgi:tyrosyl-tRNA synthetase
MGKKLYEELEARGLIDACTDADAVRKLLDSDEPVTTYIGFDCTALSLHCGSLIPIIVLRHLQNAGHRTVAIIGGGTTLVGDPSGKTETRKMLNRGDITKNVEAIRDQIGRMLDLKGSTGTWYDNVVWLAPLNYLDFLRTIGKHFSVNRMIAHESVKLRLEREEGLSFIEFNYQLLQAYDFHVLYYGGHRDIGPAWRCAIQMGGSDQWGNIVAGIDLIRREGGGQAYGVTFPLLTTSSGHKMGKTEAGSVWLDAGMTKPYDLFQYWRNVEDADVARFLRMLTFLPLDEIRKMEKLSGSDLNPWKEKLAFELTSFVHGKSAADEALKTAKSVFDGAAKDADSLPTLAVSKKELDGGLWVVEAFSKAGLAKSNSEARRAISQGGAYVNGERISDLDLKLTTGDISDGRIMLRLGKKKHARIVVEN